VGHPETNPGTSRKSLAIGHAGWAWCGDPRLRARCGSMRSIKLLLRARANLVELRVEPSDFRIQFDETQARGRNQLISPDTPVIVTGVRFHAHTGGGLLCRWIPL
jgi:hypothetical protein